MLKNNKILRFSVPSFFVLLMFWSCTDLEEAPYSLLNPSNFYHTEAELTAAVVPVYNSLGPAQWGDIAHLQAVSSDAIVVPTRGGDWDDGGVWRALQLHTWDPALGFVAGGWSGAFGGVARANSTLNALSMAEQTDLVLTYTAETRVLRALFYWWLIDLYGNVPLVTAAEVDPDNPPSQSTRTEVFDWIESEILASLDNLEASHSAAGYGRITKGAANTLLATLYLNAEVYTGTPMWSECIAACDAVINSQEYDLMPTVTDVFALENEGLANTEMILVLARLPLDGVAFNRLQATLHYNQLPSSPWNGFSVLTDFYNSFEAGDDRLNQILVGQQYVLFGPAAGDSAFDRNGNPLNFQIDFPLIDASEMDGPRMLKWPVDPNMSGWFSGTDYGIFRYSHVLLMKAEALVRSGGNGDAEVNMVRARAGLDALSGATADDIYQERGHELLWEGFRRQDQIRQGTFLGTWKLKEVADNADGHTKIFPIPQTQMDSNPNLVQNPGY